MKNNPSIDLWHHRDVDAMAFTRDTAPVFLDAVKDPKKKGLPVAGQTRITIRNEHVNYIITWLVN